MSQPKKLNCPTCNTLIEWSDQWPDRPFCSERCKLIDLGEWAAENNRIAGNSVYDEVLSGQLEESPFSGPSKG
ncbi:DNA gyrase inhibitor YacG [Halioxenophilus sp. WMMB6]|uniref:DNA gyrase inhibitor YacG n=1 Tax=Halioxenophilus sp. WMMB6 TaxID=3073815 RepID=UPI00295E43BE|nr:DNA gyrase inhibitor YacG [Halioxenophilus sp. WMMB6]